MATPPVPQPPQRALLDARTTDSEVTAVIKRLLQSPKGAFGVGVIVLLVLVAVFAPVIVPMSPTQIHMADKLKPPSSTYWFGADEMGRDIFSRVVFGTGVALQAGLMAILLAAGVGVTTGLIAGFYGGWFDAIIMRLWDTVMSFPGLFMAIGIVSVLGPGKAVAIIAIGVGAMPGFARLTRAMTLSYKEAEFVRAAVASGATNARLIVKHIFPNCLSALIVNMALMVPGAIMTEAGLSYLGLGSQPPAPSWGNMLQTAQTYLWQAPLYGIFPGMAITVFVLGMSFFAEALQDAIDPRRTRLGRRR